jgi:hypothetical protein
MLGLLMAHPSRSQFANYGDTGAYGGTVYQSIAFANSAAGRFTNDNAIISYAGPAAGTFVNDGRYVAQNGATDVFIGPGGSGGAQELGGTVAPRFYNLKLSNGAANFTSSNTAGLRVAGTLTLGNAYTITPRTAATNAAGAIHFLDGASYSGITAGDDARFIDGYVLKIGAGAFTFPIGQAGDQRSVQLTGTGLPAALDSVAVAWFSTSAATTPDPSDANATHDLTSRGSGVAAVSTLGFWDWVRLATSGSVPVSVSIPAQNTAFASAANLRLVGWNGTQWVALGTTGTASLAEGQLLSGTVPPGITALGVGAAGIPLPVELLTFTATLKGEDGLLSWRTASERNSDYFEVQQSNDGRAWPQVLGQVAAAGTSTSPRDYTYTDVRIARYGVPVVYYRLRQVDRDGTVSYSPVAALHLAPITTLAVEVWPNPGTLGTNSQVRIAAPETGPVDVSVYDVAGRLLFQQAVAPSTELPLPSAGWATGAYLVRARQGSRTVTRQLVRE